MSNQYEIIEIHNAKDFLTLGYYKPLCLTEQNYEWINWYAGEPKGLTGHHDERLRTLAGLYTSFLYRCKFGERFLLEKNNVIYWLKPTEEAMKKVEW